MNEINYQALREAAQRYQSVLAWYEVVPDSPNAERDCDAALAAFKREIRHREVDIIADLLDEREAQSKRIAELETNLVTLATENEALKSNLIYWGGEDSGAVRSPLDYARAAGLGSGEEFEVQVAARMPNLTYRVVSNSRFRTTIELVDGSLPETPATDAFLDEIRAQGVEMLAKNHQSIVNALKGDSLFSDGEYRHAAIVSAAVYFAAELRKGGNQ
ncbi:hypothetical protein IFO23_003709 [Escherichia coli]|nr:hypothetical protein [Escherichia coli]